MSESSALPSGECSNFGHPQVAVFCARCGEKQPGHHDLKVMHLLHDLVHELVHVDGKLFRTLRELILRPGQLTREYFAGQKQRSIPPLRLFLTLFALQFVAYTAYKPAAVYSVGTMKRFDTGGSLTKLLDRKAAKRHITREALAEQVDHHWRSNLSMLQLVNIVGIALVLKLLYLRRKRALAEHLVFAAHYLCFSYIVFLLIWPVYAVVGFSPGPLQKTLTTRPVVVNVISRYFAQRRHYCPSTGRTLTKTACRWGGR